MRPRIARLEFDDGLDECLIRPFRAGLRRARRRREQPAVLAWYQRLMNRQERRRAEGDGDLSDAFWTEEERPESAEQPVALRQVRRAPASTAQDDHLLLEQEILRHHRSFATGGHSDPDSNRRTPNNRDPRRAKIVATAARLPCGPEYPRCCDNPLEVRVQQCTGRSEAQPKWFFVQPDDVLDSSVQLWVVNGRLGWRR